MFGKKTLDLFGCANLTVACPQPWISNNNKVVGNKNISFVPVKLYKEITKPYFKTIRFINTENRIFSEFRNIY